MTDQETAARRFAELVEGIEIAMLTTAAEDGALRSRPMATLNAPFEGTLWFFTREPSGKTEELKRDAHVNVSYADPKRQKYVSVTGTATIVRDRAKAEEFWTPAYTAWFPAGLDDPQLALLRVDVHRAEYWESPSAAVAHLVGMWNAALTGEPAQPGRHEEITLK